MKPNFFIIGAPKCGTTAMSIYLGQHPNVFISEPKEPNYFCDDFRPAMRTITTQEGYLKLFEDAEARHLAVGEASVWYLYSKVAVHNIYNFNPAAKIIVMLRNPVDLVYSMHAQCLNSVDDDEPDFEQAWRLQDDRLKGINLPRHCSEPRKLQYRDIGKLGEQLNNVCAVFPRDQVKVIFFEDFTTDTEQVFNETLDFLNVPVLHGDINFAAVNQNTVDRFRFLAVFYRRPPRKLVDFFMRLKKVLGIKRWGIMRRLVAFNLKTQPRKCLPAEFRTELVNYFRDDVETLSHITQRDLANWR